MSDETRRRILERRARFVAAALASTSAACDRVNPMVCLEPPPITADDATAKPSSTASASATTSASTPSSADAMPLECLKIAPPPTTHPPPPPSGGAGGAKPKVCLSEMLFEDEEPKG
ncbi:MAG: hypothetical protein ACXWUG_10730 [Polyangiales bacterium]